MTKKAYSGVLYIIHLAIAINTCYCNTFYSHMMGTRPELPEKAMNITSLKFFHTINYNVQELGGVLLECEK